MKIRNGHLLHLISFQGDAFFPMSLAFDSTFVNVDNILEQGSSTVYFVAVMNSFHLDNSFIVPADVNN